MNNYCFMIYDFNDNPLYYLDDLNELFNFCKIKKYELRRKFKIVDDNCINIVINKKLYKVYRLIKED